MAVVQMLGLNAGLLVLGVLAVTPLIVALDEAFDRVPRRDRRPAPAAATTTGWTREPAALAA